ncbi:hypothetical protein H9L12_10120 [Sphingomonas rhizophila]|uniref:Uncharacterized protein n=1 Tax=Sphingomonas rhizophila TaxID=2071607 RepID=A0A7G9S9W0_9SPHN|nr:hypothetical protein [Sphingomonas rhizophila]QNN64635.1 hypothetical protein H9L12_10120 [Sphingomonas rhizophila]
MRDDIQSLRAENQELRDRVRSLEEQVRFLGQHRTLAAGITGEQLVANLVGGHLTSHGAPHDIEVRGELVEVKFAKLSRPNRSAPTLRWQWQKIYGERGGKAYDHLLLVGETDPRFSSFYLDPDSPFVFFLVPFAEARRLCIKGNPLGMTLNSNPVSARGSSVELFEKWQVTASEIERRFRLAGAEKSVQS